MNSSSRKSKFLGIPHGTALARLRKSIMFRMAQRLGEDVCYRCGQRINRVEDFSIEHKEPWEGVNVEKFWDLENIAFSHLYCNRPHNYNGGGTGADKILPPNDSVAWCSGHKDFINRSLFDKGSRWDGLRQYCKTCRSDKYKQGKGR